MFDKFKKFMTIILPVITGMVITTPVFAGYDFAHKPNSPLSPDVRESNSAWYYYINGEKDMSYTGLCTNRYGTWWINGGTVAFNDTTYYNWNADVDGAGGWVLSGGKIENGSCVTSADYIDDNNSFTGRLIVGDSRCVQLYRYNNYENYDEASFEVTWGGGYNPDATPTITGSGKLEHMATYINDSLKMRGYCDVYLFSSINDTWYPSMEEGIQYEFDTVDYLSSRSEVFNGETVYPTIYIIGLIDAMPLSSYQKGANFVSPWNEILKNECNIHNNWEYLDYLDCIDGYTDDLHYNDETLKNIWKKILKCQHKYKVYETNTLTRDIENDICVKCGNVIANMTDKPTNEDKIIIKMPKSYKLWLNDMNLYG